MLARTYRTAKQLGLSEEKYQALFKVLEMLETGKLKHDKKLRHKDYGFNMNCWCHCMGGWAEKEGNLNFRYKEMDDLFYPPRAYNYSKITPQQAAVALNNYLTFGKPYWDNAMGGV